MTNPYRWWDKKSKEEQERLGKKYNLPHGNPVAWISSQDIKTIWEKENFNLVKKAKQ